jgi:hypothetical protein
LSASGIGTDLGGAANTKVRIAHVISGGSTRGLDVRNMGPAMARRRIDAEIVDNDFSSGSTAIPPRSAIRLVNFIGADGGQIHAVMSGNLFHHSQSGCFAGNNRSNSGIVNVRSNGDRFEDNEVGCSIVGANVTSGTTNSASTTFEAHGSKFMNNTVGILAVGAEAGGQTNVAFDNTVMVSLVGSKASNNQDKDFEAVGAQSTAGIAGTNNKVTIELKGVSKQIDVVKTDSQPPEPALTNTVTVIR